MTNTQNSIITSLNHPTTQRALVLLFVICTTILFLFLNKIQPNYYIDEAFHIPQTQRFCNGTFFEWDNKITTLPGLYLITASVLAPFKLCTTLFLRGVNLIGTFFNLYLIYEIMCTTTWAQKLNKSKNETWLLLAVTFSITLFPPLFFWHFLFYTDVISVNLVLLMFLLHQKQYYKNCAAAGALAVLVRQTNIIWVVLLIGERVITIIEDQTPQSISALVSRGMYGSPIHAKLVWNNTVHHTRRGIGSFFIFIKEIIEKLKAEITVIVVFLIFIIWNRGIVIGDRNAHIATIHLPQLFYFSVFSFGFSWPYMVPYWREFFQWIRKHWIIFNVLLVLMTIIVHNNTLVHPYLLADNRHYVFYVWSKLMGRYYTAKYFLIPIYAFTIYCLVSSIREMRFLSKLLYIGCICVVLIPQLLLEPRYFVIPYILLRMNMAEPKLWQITAEIMTILLINCLQFYIFVTKTFYWTDQEGPQRISW
ncbi:hypothetical protein PV326_002500 [Microctonus aethiopoides]|nr:hypothetical protein PV326_002500 [Microctonus aethiopoides]